MIEVKLEPYEFEMAARVGFVRRIRLTIKGFDSSYFNPNQSEAWGTDIEAACAELAVAKSLNVFWDGSVGTFKKPDVGPYQVRHTVRHDRSLIVRPKDADDEIYIFVTGSAPQFKLRGWLRGNEAKRDQFQRNPNSQAPAWFVPSSRLRDMEILKNQPLIDFFEIPTPLDLETEA
jgi:hypothetical protein